MSRRSDTTETNDETSRASVCSQANAADQPKRTKIIYVVYIITALDITWMFLQFSVTPVSKVTVYLLCQSTVATFP